MITQQHTQESLSRAYIQAVAGCAGVNCEMKREFDYGVDGTFRQVTSRGQRLIETGFPLDFQLKCTVNWEHEGQNVAYSLKSKTYNDLVTRDPEGIGVVLILLCIPQVEQLWAQFNEDSLTLRHCCYYQTVTGEPVENENSTKKILIPRINVLNAESLRSLMTSERNRKMNGGV